MHGFAESFGRDQDRVERDGGRGHRSGTIGGEPCFLLTVQFGSPVAAPARDPFG